MDNTTLTHAEWKAKYDELEADFKHVVDVNRVVSERYTEFIHCLPTSAEMKCARVSIQAMYKRNNPWREQALEPVEDRLAKLKKLQSAIDHLAAEQLAAHAQARAQVIP